MRSKRNTEAAEMSPSDRVSQPKGAVTNGQNNQSALLARLYKDHAEELSGYLRKAFGHGPPEPDDVAQQAFQKLAAYHDLSAINNLRAFLWRTARNIVLTHKRNEDARSKYDFEIEHLFFAVKGNESNPERVLEVKEQLVAINGILHKMPEKRRNAFIWHRVEGLNVAAVARRLGMTRAAALKHIVRAALDIDAALNNVTGRKD